MVALVLLGSAGLWAALAAQQARNDVPEAPIEDQSALDPDAGSTAEPEPEPSPEPEPEPEPVWDIDSPDSITVVVNKHRPLDPADWAPDDLVMPDVPNNNGQPLRKAAARASFVLVDPPRAGLDTDTRTGIIEARIPAFTYVSCDPTTLARDLKVFLAEGYTIERVRGIDLFPQTHHIEVIAHLRRIH